MPYGTIFLLVACASFFAKAAEMEGRPRAVGAMLSLGAWIVCAQLGIGGLFSQLLLFVAWGGVHVLRDWLAERRGT